jgi:predicted O-methyltransferase YrrM
MNDGLKPSAREYKKLVGDKPVTLLEIGVMQGRNAYNLYNAFNIDKLYLVDQWFKKWESYDYPHMLDVAMQTFEKFEGKDDVIIIRTNSLKFDLFQDSQFDYIYLDSNHSYEHVQQELPKYWKYLKKGGMFCGDNIEQAGMRKALDEFCESNGLSYKEEAYKKAAKSGIDVLEWWLIK